MTERVSFWIYNGINTDQENRTEASSYLLVSLEQGESFSTSSGGPCDEGYHREWDRYSYDGDSVISENETDSSGCDGRFSTSQSHVCPIGDLRAWLNPDGVPMPRWIDGCRSSQRDYAAEAMGY